MNSWNTKSAKSLSCISRSKRLHSPNWRIARNLEACIESPAKGFETQPYLDLCQIDFDALREHFKQSRKRTEMEMLRGAIHSKLSKMVRLNRQRMDFYQKFQQMIDEYNQGAATVEETLDMLPGAYSCEVYRSKCDLVYQHVYESYYGEGRSIYASVA